ncbi:hypothetical protein SAY87_016185 [Trapa incisa]|uniref:Lipoxygenase n=1 Tax=Trapa incisa TaxID=236973 RepID=A0AAN7QU76_9MYRT|nr:hypothetical protein SAY87_016185 [Trapa incisa]
MLKPQLVHSAAVDRSLAPAVLVTKQFFHGHSLGMVLPHQHQHQHRRQRHAAAGRQSRKAVRLGFVAGNIRAEGANEESRTATVKAVVTVIPPTSGELYEFGIKRGLDDITDLLGKTILLELVSSELKPISRLENQTVKGYAHKTKKANNQVEYECEMKVDEEFGEVGAILVENEHHKEMFLKDVVLDGLPGGPVTISCSSWVASKFDNPNKRVFFTNKSFLPSETPDGLKRLRENELKLLRGDGQGERKTYDRIYDYDFYNDIGDPDSSPEKKRPVLGGSKKFPYPRRCRTGRPRSESDPESESRASTIYVPRDEAFSAVKNLAFSAKTVYSALHAVLPSLETALIDTNLPFPYFTAIEDLFGQGFTMPKLPTKGLSDLLPWIVNSVKNAAEDVVRFETPEAMLRDSFFWFSDEEFSRQTLAGINPYTIQLVTEWPMKSKLDPSVYGPPESAITTETIHCQIGGFMSVHEAVREKKLFVLDYHDLLLPYVNKVRQIKGTTLYGSRTLFFLTPRETLMPIAIELTRPPMDGKPQWKQVFTPAYHSTECWLWRLAKAHVLAHDSGVHELVTHWLRTHCAVEPYIIATNRQLSAMHPIYRLLHPHFRYTMEINALARQVLINAGGIIEISFSPAKYSMELSSMAYDLQWQFNLQALPNDLIHRGMAVEDPTAPHGLRLAIQDYPFANDGLLIWDSLKQWVTDYVNHYYCDSSLVESDDELQSWWSEIRNVGHGDKKYADGWPELKTAGDLIEIITTIAWVSSAHHAAVNFAQYDYGGYFPNRPSIARTNMPVEDPTEQVLNEFRNKPEATLLKCFPTPIQATVVMATLDVLSTHSPDEEYLGEHAEPAWKDDPIVKAAFERFSGRLKEIEGIIDARNEDRDRKNRNGAGIVPYKLMKPFSKPGVTGQGIPYSVSI